MVNRFNGQSGVKFATANPSGGGPPHSKAASPQKFGMGVGRLLVIYQS